MANRSPAKSLRAGAGYGGLSAHQTPFGLNGGAGSARAVNAFQTAPSYQFQLAEGQKALERFRQQRAEICSSGATGKGPARYGQGVANQALRHPSGSARPCDARRKTPGRRRGHRPLATPITSECAEQSGCGTGIGYRGLGKFMVERAEFDCRACRRCGGPEPVQDAEPVPRE